MLTVTGGIGSGSYPIGAAVNIGIGSVPKGQEFDRWEEGDAKIDDVNAAQTKVIIPAHGITITAKFKPATKIDKTQAEAKKR